MTIDEAIKRYEEEAEEQEQMAEKWVNDGWQKCYINLTSEKEEKIWKERRERKTKCLKCATEHRQLAEWLRELKEFKKLSTYGREYRCKDCEYEDAEYFCDDCIWHFIDKFKPKEVKAVEDKT